jgi:UDP-2-acetamido-2,6-beta-L-arabino-hexul-4-ose reductase
MTRVAVTGSDGFIGKNLLKGLSYLDGMDIRCYDRNSTDRLEDIVQGVDIIYHLAGINRPENPSDFNMNVDLTSEIINILENLKQKPAIVFSSSAQAALENPYGVSKKAAEELLIKYHEKTNAPVYIYRLPGVFGKWSRPNYNTVVATFCYNIARDMNISISDPNRELELVYIDDVVESLISILQNLGQSGLERPSVTPVYKITLGKLADTICEFRASSSLNMDDLPDSLTKCLYATYQSFLP